MTTTTITNEGQVVLPLVVRSKLHLAPGTKFVCEVEGDSVILRPERPASLMREYLTDPQTGLRVTKRREDMEPVTSEMVQAFLEENL